MCGDLFGPNAAPGALDVVVSERALQGFEDGDLALAVTAIDGRLMPNGEVQVWAQNSAERLRRIADRFVELGYLLADVARPPLRGERKVMVPCLASG